MTQKLYYFDAYMSEFSADVVSCQSTEKGFAVVLDKTAFYPEGGGHLPPSILLTKYIFRKLRCMYFVSKIEKVKP